MKRGLVRSANAQEARSTHRTNPSLIKPSVSGMMGLPCASLMGSMVVAHSKDAISMKRELLAT